MAPDPAATLAHIRSDVLRSNLSSAFEQADEQKSEWLHRDPAWSFQFCLLQAEILELQGKSQDVVNVLRNQDRTFTPEGDLAIRQLLLLSLANARLGYQEQSEAEVSEAERLGRSTHSVYEGEVLRTRGSLEDRKGQETAAQASFRLSLEFARQHHDVLLEASDLLNLGYTSLHLEHFDEALDDFRLSSQLAATIHADFMQQIDIGNTGWAYFDLGDFDRATDSFREARSEAQRLGATDSEILWRQSEGLSLSRLGEMKQAQACYEDALHAAQTNKNFTMQAQTETALAFLFLQLNQLGPAQSHADAAFSISKQIKNHAAVRDADLALSLIASREPGNPEAETMLLRVQQEARDRPSVRWQSQEALAKLYTERRHSLLAEKWYREAIRTFEAQRNSVQSTENRLPFLANGNDLYRHYANFLIANNRSTEALSLLDSARAKTLKEGRSLAATKGVNAAYHTPSADPNSVTLFYSMGYDQSYVWVVNGRTIHLLSLPAEAEIKTHIDSYQSSILKSRDPLQDRNPDALWLYSALVAPAEPFLRSASNITLIPDGTLNGFNMETLIHDSPRGLCYWIDDVTLTTAASLWSRQNTPPEKHASAKPGAPKLLLIGDPLLATPEYQQLPHAGTEIDDVAHHFSAAQRSQFTRAEAVPAVYGKANAGQYDYVHFVAHGVASTLRPLDSAIVLSRPPSDVDHYKLYARDIVQTPLHARLVTISACYGSGIRNYAGEGLVGLAWAFLRAGAHQVIAALWEVNDESTPQLMDHMYSELDRGARPEQALRSAKLSLLHSQGVFRKPLYWAAFQIYSGH